MNRAHTSTYQRGFSLVEIAIVLVIISVLIAIVAVPLATQVEQRRGEETLKQLEQIKEAIIGYAIANGRLPCPAVATGNEEFVPVTGNAANGNCLRMFGFVPAVTLGLSGLDANGFIVDAWGLQQNRIRYAVADVDFTPPGTPAVPACPVGFNNALTSTNGMRTATMACLADTSVALNMLTICPTTPNGGAGTPNNPSSVTSCTAPLTSKAPFVVYSLGKNAATGGAGDEAYNLDADAYFVSHTPTPAGSAAGEFDDLVTWGSINTLFARMVQAGKLP